MRRSKMRASRSAADELRPRTARASDQFTAQVV